MLTPSELTARRNLLAILQIGIGLIGASIIEDPHAVIALLVLTSIVLTNWIMGGHE